jgi:hypothetical protein
MYCNAYGSACFAERMQCSSVVVGRYDARWH